MYKFKDKVVFQTRETSGALLYKLLISDGKSENTVIINNTPNWIYQFHAKKDRFYFLSSDELWVSNGLENSGIKLSNNENGLKVQSIIHIYRENNLDYFIVDDTDNKHFEIWQTDGNVENTHVTDANPIEYQGNFDQLIGPVKKEDNYYFLKVVDAPGNGRMEIIEGDHIEDDFETIKSENTSVTQGYGEIFIVGNRFYITKVGLVSNSIFDGLIFFDFDTNEIKSIITTSNISYPFEYQIYDGELYFYHEGIWKTDESIFGATKIIHNIGSYFVNSYSNFLIKDDLIYFQGSTSYSHIQGCSFSDSELFQYNVNTTESTLVTDLNQIPLSARIFPVYPAGEKIFFITGNPEVGMEPHVYNESNGESKVLGDLHAGLNSCTLAHDGETIFLYNQDDIVYMASRKDLNTSFSLFKSDGSLEGTKLVSDADIYTQQRQVSVAEVGEHIYFPVKSNGINGPTLYRYNGNQESNFYMEIEFPTDNDNISGYPGALISFKEEVFFVFSTTNTGREIWKTNGDKIELVKDVQAGKFSGLGTGTYFNEGELTNGDDQFFFVADDGIHGLEIWASDGTTEGTKLLKDINEGPNGSEPYSLTFFNDELYFFAKDEDHDYELWKSDGTESGTVMLTDVDYPDILPYRIYPNPKMRSLRNKLYFRRYTEDEGNEFWEIDGTNEGTRIAFDLNPGPDDIQFNGFTYDENSDRFIMAKTDVDGVIELFSSLEDLENFKAMPGIEDLNIRALRTFFISNDKLYFIAVDMSLGETMFSYDLSVLNEVEEPEIEIVGIRENENSNFIIYPIPSKDKKFNLQFPPGYGGQSSIEIYDVSGKSLDPSAFSYDLENKLLNLKMLKSGLYFIRIRIQGKLFTEKIWIQ